MVITLRRAETKQADRLHLIIMQYEVTGVELGAITPASSDSRIRGFRVRGRDPLSATWGHALARVGRCAFPKAFYTCQSQSRRHGVDTKERFPFQFRALASWKPKAVNPHFYPLETWLF